MKTYWGAWAVLFMASVCSAGEEPLPVPPPPAEDRLFASAAEDDFSARLAEMEQELRSLRAMVAEKHLVQTAEGKLMQASCLSGGSIGCDSLTCDGLTCDGLTCDGSGLGCDGYSSRYGDAFCDDGDPAVYVGLDFAILQPHVGSLRLPGSGVTITPDHDFEFAPRVYAGFVGKSGLGGQITYWELETTDDNTSPTTGISSDLELRTFDVDVTQTSQFRHWAIQVGAGARYGKLQGTLHNLFGFNDRIRGDFEGGGPTFLVNVRRPVGLHGWALVGEGRASFLFGDTDITSSFAPELEVREHLTQVWEGRFGLEWTGSTRSGNALFFARGLVEAQVWEVAPIAGILGTDLGFIGPTVSAGFVF